MDKSKGGRLKGPLRLTRLCILSIILPGILIAGPLYLRYRVYSGQVYPVGMSDMRLVDNRISTTWCQRQLVKSNATFNAYLLPDEPKLKPNPVRVSMVRYLELKDDMKEYWGFYLLKGSSFTVSTCCRWPGAFLTVIRGHKQLRECAYFGDDSSEEEDELDMNGKEEDPEDPEDEAQSNEPWMMRKARPGVIFHGSQQMDTMTKYRLSKEITGDTGNEHLHDWLPVRSRKVKDSGNDDEKTTTVIKANETGSLEEIYQDVMERMKSLGYKESKALRKMLAQLNDKLKNEDHNSTDSWEKETFQRKREIAWRTLQEELNRNDDDYDAAEEEDEEAETLMYEDLRGAFNETTFNDRSDSEFWSSFSSSEERLINCAGLIVNLPLIPKKGCQATHTEQVRAKASLANKFTYTVPTNGYYFFVFSSENEMQTNYIRVEFQFEKILYNVSNPVAACTNTTESCSLPLNFFSYERMVLEMPISQNDSMWNQEYVVVSICEPRTIVYAACVVAVPVLILLFAF
ncbi:hypothetical protein RUM44_011611 [Polyplax serrata]|uniref:E3 ubiquitin-protein ligase APD1-4 middle domain-containing protein n=1 Tax=Polyplax serrata TaxID=468196 RepID=A0ABR1AQM0_POLSC